MTREEIVKEARQLPLAERKAAVEEITSSIREEIEANGSATSGKRHAKDESGREEKPGSIDNQDQLSIDERMAVVQRLFGILKRDGEAPTDEELKEEYANYLAEKYS
jgi:hypothetical protein